jgi:hypothetical protein
MLVGMVLMRLSYLKDRGFYNGQHGHSGAPFPKLVIHLSTL